MLGQRPRSYPVALALCAVLLLLFGLSRHVSRQVLPIHGTMLAMSEDDTVQRAEEKVRVNHSNTEEQVINEDPEEIVNPDFYSDAYWSTSFEKRSEVRKKIVFLYTYMHDASIVDKI